LKERDCPYQSATDNRLADSRLFYLQGEERVASHGKSSFILGNPIANQVRD
jgi:hypothetical protein